MKQKWLGALMVSLIYFSCSTEIEKLQFYDSDFHLDSNSNIRTDGYYLISYDFSISADTSYHPASDKSKYELMNPIDKSKKYIHQLSYGFIQFFKDGYCRVEPWKHGHDDSLRIDSLIQNDSIIGRAGLYELNGDTVKIEFHIRTKKSLWKTLYQRIEVIFTISENQLTYFSKEPEEPLLHPPICKGYFIRGEFKYYKYVNSLSESKNLHKFVND